MTEKAGKKTDTCKQSLVELKNNNPSPNDCYLSLKISYEMLIFTGYLSQTKSFKITGSLYENIYLHVQLQHKK